MKIDYIELRKSIDRLYMINSYCTHLLFTTVEVWMKSRLISLLLGSLKYDSVGQPFTVAVNHLNLYL